MSRLPRNPKESLFGRRTLFFSILQWLVVLVMTLTIYRAFKKNGQSEIATNTATFITLVIGNLSLILVNRSRTHSIIHMFKVKNKILFPILIWTILCLIAIVYIPSIANIFHFTSIGIEYFLLAIAVWFFSVLRFEIVKLVARKKGIELLKN
jgi:Ca2+-transporting ATPase